MSLPFRIKICGITNSDDALFSVQAGADALGLNFFAGSKRCVSVEGATAITGAVRGAATKPAAVCLTGVFVNASLDEIVQIVRQVKLDAVQLHGDETPEDLLALATLLRQVTLPGEALPLVIRAFRCQEPNLQSVASYLHACESSATSSELLPHAVLLDAYQPGSYGGTGAVVDWDLVREERPLLGNRPLILAGGLVPSNVAAAIRTAMPDAVDVASGVEASPGKKDPALVQAFITAAQRAFGTSSLS